MSNSILNHLAIDGNERFVWNPDLGHLEVIEGEINRYTLLLASRPSFLVRDIRLSPTKNLLALIGDKGVHIVELPKKWGRRGKSEVDGKIYCKTYKLNDRLFSCEVRLRILHCTWHPLGSDTKQLLFILTNDNKLRIHDVTEDSEVQVINLKAYDQNEDKDGDEDESRIRQGLSMLNLGESAICFDFGPPLIIQEPDVLWPIYVLMGTGDILLVYFNFQNPTYSEHIIGPLVMLPEAEDSYGSDACSLIVLDSSPPMIAIATTRGSIYHSFAFVNKTGPLSVQTLYVYESIELSKDLIDNPDNAYNPHPMRLFKDPTSEIRYFCVHENGVHTIVVPIIDSIRSELEITEDKESFSEFIVCTRTTTPAEILDDDGVCPSTPRGLGVEIRTTNIVLLVLMPDNDLITQRISPATALINRKRFPRHSLNNTTRSETDNDTDILNVSQIATRANFEEQIQQILKRKTSVPMLKLSESLEDQRHIIELVNKTVTNFRNEYIKKYNLAAEAIKKKLSILENDLENQRGEYNKITKMKEEVYMSVVALSSKSASACEKQKDLLARLDKINAAITSRYPELSEVESKQRREVQALREKLRLLRDELDSVDNKHKYNMNQKDSLLNANGDLILSPIQEECIRETLAKHSNEIAELQRFVKSKKLQQK